MFLARSDLELSVHSFPLALYLFLATFVPTGDFLKIGVPLLNKTVNLFSIYTRSMDEFIQSHRLKTLLNANEPQKCLQP